METIKYSKKILNMAKKRNWNCRCLTHTSLLLDDTNRVLKCDVTKFSFLHFSIFMTIFQ